jgi:hypothetical protein
MEGFMQLPDKIEKGGPHYKAASDQSQHRDIVCEEHYRQDSRTASHKPLRLIHDDALPARVLQKAAVDVREHPQRLPLWAFRLYQYQRRGGLGYRAIWDTLTEAGRSVGSAKWTRDCLLHAIAEANVTTEQPPSIEALLRGLI